MIQEKSLNYLWRKQQVTTHNIANVDTPGYKAKYVTFEDELQSRLNKLNQGATSSQIRRTVNQVNPKIQESKGETARLDGNNVDMDVEQVELARTTMQYQYLLDSVNKDISRLRTIIRGQ